MSNEHCTYFVNNLNNNYMKSEHKSNINNEHMNNMSNAHMNIMNNEHMKYYCYVITVGFLYNNEEHGTFTVVQLLNKNIMCKIPTKTLKYREKNCSLL